LTKRRTVAHPPPPYPQIGGLFRESRRNSGHAHDEIARYGSLIAGARQLGRNDRASILQKTPDEERTTDRKPTLLAEGKINLRAAPSLTARRYYFATWDGR